MTKYGPKGPHSPTLGVLCVVCGNPLAVGDYTTFLPRPLSDAKRYSDDSPEVHWGCVCVEDSTTR